MLSSFAHRLLSAAFVACLLVSAGPALARTEPGLVPVPTPHRPLDPAGAEPGAPTTVQLKGVVLNADGRPCAGASVFPAGAPRQLVVTDAQGAFVLPVPAGAALALQVDYFGVGSSRVVVEKPTAELLRITLGQ